mgnify:CR=1 FL=1
MENVAFSVELKDGVSQPATDIAAALRALAQAAKGASKIVPTIQLPTLNAGGVQQAAAAMANMTSAAKAARSAGGGPLGGAAKDARDFSAEVKRAQAQLDKLRADPAGYKKMLDLQRQLNSERAKVRGDQQQGFWSSFTGKLPYRTVAQYTQAEFAGTLMATGVTKAVDLLVSGVTKAVSLLVDGFKLSIEAGSKLSNLRLGERLTLQGGEASFRSDVERFSDRTGLDDDDIRKLMLPMRRAGMSQEAARSAFAAATDMAAGTGEGGNLGVIKEYLDLFQKIQLKGGIGEKQLVGAGFAPREVYGTLSKELGISTAEAKKRSEEGQIDPQRLNNAIYKSIEKRQGGMLGTGGEEWGKTLPAKLARLQQLPENIFKSVLDSPGWQKLSDAIEAVLNKFDPKSETGGKIVAFITDMFTRVAGLTEKLASDEGLAKVSKVIDDIIVAVKAMITVASALQSYAAFLEKMAGYIPVIALSRWAKDKMVSPDESEPSSPAGVPSTPSTVSRPGTNNFSMVPTTTINVYGATPENGKQIGSNVGSGVAGSVISALERAVAEMGAQ